LSANIEQNIILDQKIVNTTTPPGKWKVVFINDNKTPMDFVIQVLQMIFKHNESTAQTIMHKVHEEGQAVAGVYTYEIAEQKSSETQSLARANKFPLTLNLEPE
jgi:ATP-dependent Clp protease adaptor protein ClpS